MPYTDFYNVDDDSFAGRMDSILSGDQAPQPGNYRVEHVLATADDVRAEAARRMMAFVGARDARNLDIKISNATREAVRLLKVKAGGAWSADETARAAELEALDAKIEAIRAASNALESALPSDFMDDRHWPSF